MEFVESCISRWFLQDDITYVGDLERVVKGDDKVPKLADLEKNQHKNVLKRALECKEDEDGPSNKRRKITGDYGDVDEAIRYFETKQLPSGAGATVECIQGLHRIDTNYPNSKVIHLLNKWIKYTVITPLLNQREGEYGYCRNCNKAVDSMHG